MVSTVESGEILETKSGVLLPYDVELDRWQDGQIGDDDVAGVVSEIFLVNGALVDFYGRQVDDRFFRYETPFERHRYGDTFKPEEPTGLRNSSGEFVLLQAVWARKETPSYRRSREAYTISSLPNGTTGPAMLTPQLYVERENGKPLVIKGELWTSARHETKSTDEVNRLVLAGLFKLLS